MRNCWKPLPSACHLNLSLFLQKQLSCNNSANGERVVTTISIIKAPVRYQPENYQLVNVYNKYSHSYDNLKKSQCNQTSMSILLFCKSWELPDGLFLPKALYTGCVNSICYALQYSAQLWMKSRKRWLVLLNM